MERVKKVELVLDSLDVADVLAGLDRLGVQHYTILSGVTGRGDRGSQSGAPFTAAFENTYLIVVCSDEQAQQIVEVVRPVLASRGGLCLLSDVRSVGH